MGEAFKLRGQFKLASYIDKYDVTASFLSLSAMNRVQADTPIDWWMWVVVGGLIAIALVVTILYRSPPGSGSVVEKRLILNAKINYCLQ